MHANYIIILYKFANAVDSGELEFEEELEPQNRNYILESGTEDDYSDDDKD